MPFWRKTWEGVCLWGIVHYHNKGLSKGPYQKDACCQRGGLDVCGGSMWKEIEDFLNNRLLLQHKKNHENLPCQECNKTFPSRRNLNRHRKRVHRQEQQNSDEDSINYVPAQQVDLQELMSLSTFNLEGAVVIPLELDPLTSWGKATFF